MYKNSDYGEHIRKGHSYDGDGRISYVKNILYITCKDTTFEYNIYNIYPGRHDNFYVENINDNKGESWRYKCADEEGNFIFEETFHSESDAYWDEYYSKHNIGKYKKSYSNSTGSGSSKSSGSSRKKSDSYNSSRYKDADSFADDYYEEFYDYEDYEDDDDAYDGAVDYWNDRND